MIPRLSHTVNHRSAAFTSTDPALTLLASAMETPDFFVPFPLVIDPSTKIISTTSPNPSNDLSDALSRVNNTHRSLQQIDPPNLLAPPPPQPPFVNPKRSQQIQKLREAAQTAMKKQSSQSISEPDASSAPQSEAVKLYTLALDMALQRPPWEPQQLLREELAAIYTSRAAAYGSIRAWADAYTDCRLSLEAKRQGNPGAWRIGCDALKEMGRATEAGDWVRRAVAEEEGTLGQLKNQLGQMQQGHPGLSQAKNALQGFERELEALREQGRGLGVFQ